MLTNQIACVNISFVSGKQTTERRGEGSIAQLGEHLPYKQRVTGSSPVVPTIKWPGSSAGQNASLSRQTSWVRAPSRSPFYASVAQLVEQGTENPRVVGSIPTGGTINLRIQLIWQSATLPRWRQRVRASSPAPNSKEPHAFLVSYGTVAKW